MLVGSIQPPCCLFTRFEPVSLRTTGTYFLYAFHSRLPFICLSLDVDRSVPYCYYDVEHYLTEYKDHSRFFIQNSLPLNNYFILSLTTLCSFVSIPNLYVVKVQIILLLQLNFFSNMNTRLQVDNVIYTFSIKLLTSNVIYYGAS